MDRRRRGRPGLGPPRRPKAAWRAFLAFYIVGKVGDAVATQPVEQFLAGFDEFMPYGVALGIAVFFVVLSQVKINVTNAYSGSLRWTNFFSTALRWYPGRVWFVFFNVGIALVLMEANMFSFLNDLLGFYSNVAIAWIGAVVADLVINKPLLKTSPSFIEFKRAHLPNFNPIGFGAMVSPRRSRSPRTSAPSGRHSTPGRRSWR